MNFTDIFIRRPVLAMVVSLMILVLGLRSLATLPVLQFPKTENAVVTVTTTYFGASAETLAGFITTPLENAIAQANGIDYMTSTSNNGVSTITVDLRLNYDADKALTEISAKVNSVLNQLPPQSQQPTLSIKVAQTTDALYLAFNSDVLQANQITDYLTRVVQPQLQAVEGVQTAEILGAKHFALRVWLNPKKLAAYGLTASDVRAALGNNDYVAGLGNTKGQMVQVNLTASTSLHTVDQFRDLVLLHKNGALVRLKDVGNVTLGADSYDSLFQFSGKNAVAIGIQVAPTANLLDVIKRVRAKFPAIQAALPNGLTGYISYDSTKFVNSAITEVIRTLVEALIIVTLVVFAFLGSPRSVFIPTVAIPLSLVGALTMMLAFGFSINLLTLLALVLAIGLVVDDAIIVVENVNRHMEEGMRPMAAALSAARELAGPIVAMTVVLVAVYVPIGFQGGLTGALFTEFAFTLVGTVVVSAIIALTLSPMMCSRLLRPHDPAGRGWEDRLVAFIDRRFEELHSLYTRLLHGALNTLPVIVVFALIVLGSIYFLFSISKSELAPQEDQGFLLTFATAAPDATLNQRVMYTKAIYKAMASYPENDNVFQFNAPGQSISGWVLKPWDERSKDAAELQKELQPQLDDIAGVRIAAFQPPSLPGARGLPVQFVIGTTHPFDQLYTVSQKFLKAVQGSGRFVFVQSDLKLDQPQSEVVIDRSKTAQLGLTMNDVGSTLASMLGGGYVNYFDLDGRSYKVIPQVEQRYRLNPSQLSNYYIKAADGSTVPLSTVATIKNEVVPESINHFQQLNSATIQGVPFPGLSTGDVLSYLKTLSKKMLPPGYTIDYSGPSRQYIRESSGFAATFAFALIIIFLALAALFESFRDPLIILVSVPMSIAGALFFVVLVSDFNIAGASMNIYTEVGLVTLMGLISKHGILITEFANHLQEQGKSKREAIEEASGIRLRPILMTTAAMVLGTLPLVIATGAGAVSRFSMGLVITSGIAVGTLFTLFVVPAAYLLIAKNHQRERENADAA